MTTTHQVTTHGSHDGSRAIPLAAIAVTVVSLALTVYGAHDLTEILIVSSVILVAVIGVYGLVLPRALMRPSAGGTALALSLPAALVTLPAFWSGLPLVLGVAGAMVGFAGRRAASGARASIAAVVLGALASMAYLAIYLIDGFILGNHN